MLFSRVFLALLCVKSIVSLLIVGENKQSSSAVINESDDDSSIGVPGCIPDAHIQTPSYYSLPSLYTDQIISVTLNFSPSRREQYCPAMNIPVNFKLTLGTNKIHFNITIILSLPASTYLGSQNVGISLPATPGLFINNDNLPGYLVVTDIDSGNGFKPASLTQGKVPVALIHEHPKVFPSFTKIYRTKTTQLHISGEGFSDRFSKLSLTFKPALVVDIDYSITVVNREDLIVTLLDGKSWRQVAGYLIVTQIVVGGILESVGGSNGIRVAAVIKDFNEFARYGIDVYPSVTKLYPSSPLYSTISMHGAGFSAGMPITLSCGGAGSSTSIFDTIDVDKHTLYLSLRPGNLWPVGPLSVTSVNGDHLNNAIQIATILAQPTVLPGNKDIYFTKTKTITIKGSGFTTLSDLKLALSIDSTLIQYNSNHPVQVYYVESVTADTIRLGLKPGSQWIPQSLSPITRTAVKVTSIDTGAGPVVLKSPVVIGYIVPDPLPQPPVIANDDGSSGDDISVQIPPPAVPILMPSSAPVNRPYDPPHPSSNNDSNNNDDDQLVPLSTVTPTQTRMTSSSPISHLRDPPASTTIPSSVNAADPPSVSDNTDLNHSPGASPGAANGSESAAVGIILGLLFFCLWSALCFYIYIRVRFRHPVAVDTMDEDPEASLEGNTHDKRGNPYNRVVSHAGPEDMVEIELNDPHTRHTVYDTTTNA